MTVEEVFEDQIFDRKTGRVNKPKPNITMEDVMDRGQWAVPGTSQSKKSGVSIEDVMRSTDHLIHTPAKTAPDDLNRLFGRDLTGNDIVVQGDGGGYAAMPRDKVESNAGLMDFMSTGRTGAQRKAETDARRRKAFMSDVKSRIGQRASQKGPQGMYQKKAFLDTLPGGLEGARVRQEEGTMSMDDALALGLRRSRYGDFGTRSETVTDGTDNFGRTRTRSRTVDRSPEEWLEETFNKPQRSNQAKHDLDMLAAINEAVGAGTLIPKVGEDGNVTGYDRKPEPEPWRPTEIDTNGDGVPDGVTTSPNSYQRFPEVAESNQPLYAWKEGMPSRMLLDDQTLGIVDPVKKYFRAIPIEMKKVNGVDPRTQKRGEYLVPNYDITGLEKYNDWAPDEKPEEIDPKAIVAQVRAEHPEWTREQIIAESRRIAGQ